VKKPKYVVNGGKDIHARLIGSKWNQKLACIVEALSLADDHYGYPPDHPYNIAIGTLKKLSRKKVK
jgi:hypothetical protein